MDDAQLMNMVNRCRNLLAQCGRVSRGEGTFHYYAADYDALRKLTDYVWEDCCRNGGGKCC